MLFPVVDKWEGQGVSRKGQLEPSSTARNFTIHTTGGKQQQVKTKNGFVMETIGGEQIKRPKTFQA